MKTEAVSAFVYQLSTMAYFFIFMYFFFNFFYSTYLFCTVTILSKKHDHTDEFLQPVCLVSPG